MNSKHAQRPGATDPCTPERGHLRDDDESQTKARAEAAKEGPRPESGTAPGTRAWRRLVFASGLLGRAMRALAAAAFARGRAEALDLLLLLPQLLFDVLAAADAT